METGSVAAQPTPAPQEVKATEPAPELQSLFERAKRLYDGGYYEQANNCLQKIADRDPGFPGLKAYQDKLLPLLKKLVAATPNPLDASVSGVVTNAPKKVDVPLLDERHALTTADIKADQKETEAKRLFDRGVAAFDDGYFTTAKPLFLKSLALDPTSTQAKEYLAKLEPLLQGADTNAPVVHVDAKKITPPREADVLLQKVWELVEAEKYDEIITNMTRVIDLDPTLLSAWYQLGWAYWQTGKKEKTLALWQKLETLAPGTPRTYNLLAQVHIGQGQMREGEAYLNKSLAMDPSQFWTRFAKARVMLWSGRAPEAIPLLNALSHEQTDNVSVLIQLAHAYDQDRQYEQALDLWKQLRALDQENGNYILGEARERLGMGDLQGADQCCQELLDKKVFEAEALVIRGNIAQFGHRDDPDLAIQQMRTIVGKINPTNVITRLQLMNRLMALQMGQSLKDPIKYPVKDSIQMCDDMLATDPHNINFILTRGELLLGNNEPVAAEKAFKLVLEGNPDDPEQPTNRHNRRAIVGLFEAYMGLQQFDKAEEMLNKAVALNPKDPYWHYHRALLASARGDANTAYQELDRLEREGARGAVLMLLYHGLTVSDSTPLLAASRFREQMLMLKKNGYKFLTADEIPAYFASHKDPLQRRVNEDGESADETDLLRNYTPPKAVCVTFDDALRSSFRFGTPVAEELDLRFTMNVPVGEVLEYNPSICSWDELRTYQATGRWVMGSHMMHHDVQPANVKSNHFVRPTANRYFLPEKNRVETQLEFVLRIQHEYQDSWEWLHRELNMPTNAPTFVAIPMGDIGDEDECNVDNAIQLNLSELAARYSLGFHESQFGFAVNGDNNCLYQRHELEHEDGRAVLRFAHQNNPVFLARRARAELAALQGRPHLSLQMLELLKRDGYPDELYDETYKYIKTHLSNKLAMPTQSADKEPKKDAWHLDLKEPYVGVGGTAVKDNEESKQTEISFRAGMNVTPSLTLEARIAPLGSFAHVSTVYNTSQSTVMQMTTNTAQTSVTTSSTNTSQTTQTIVGQTKTVYSNQVSVTDFSCDVVTIGGQMNYRFESGAILSLAGFQHSYTSTSAPTNSTGQAVTNLLGGTTFLGVSASIFVKPTLLADTSVMLLHDAIPALQGPIAVNSLVVNGTWALMDAWEISGRGSFESIADRQAADNTLLLLNAASLWRLSDEQGFYMGVGGEFANAGNKSLDYWTPNWLERVYLMAEIRRVFLNSSFRIGARYGIGREAGWPADVERYNANVVNSQLYGYYPGPSPDQPWASIIGVNAIFTKKFGQHWDLNFNGSVDAMESYTAYNIAADLLYHF